MARRGDSKRNASRWRWRSRRDNAVMLSAAKHLDTQRDRPFAAAQGDTRGKLQASLSCHAELQRSISLPSATDPSLRLRVTR